MIASYVLTGSDEFGEWYEQAAGTDTINANVQHELDVCVVPTGTVTASQDYEFRVSLTGTPVPLQSGASYPIVTTAAAAANEEIEQARSVSRFVFSRVHGRVN